MFSINIFTYKGDELILPYTIESCFLAFGNNCHVHVIDQEGSTIHPSIIKRVRELGGEYEVSTFDRRGNLNGKEACLGMLSCMKANLKETDYMAIKMDCDTLVISPDRFYKCIDENAKFIGSARPNSVYSGICYGIHKSIVEPAIETLKRIDIHDDAPEDIVIGSCAVLASIPGGLLIIPDYDKDRALGDTVAWNYNTELNDTSIDHYIDKFQLITYGNWFKYPHVYKKDRVFPMQYTIARLKEKYAQLNSDSNSV